MAGNFALSCHSNFWGFLCIFQAPLSQSLWSGYHWKDLFLPQKLNVGYGDFGQRWWCQKWNKDHGSLHMVTHGTWVSRLRLGVWFPIIVQREHWFLLLLLSEDSFCLLYRLSLLSVTQVGCCISVSYHSARLVSNWFSLSLLKRRYGHFIVKVTSLNCDWQYNVFWALFSWKYQVQI